MMTINERTRLDEIADLVSTARTAVARATDAVHCLNQQRCYDLSPLRVDLARVQNELAGASDDIELLLRAGGGE